MARLAGVMETTDRGVVGKGELAERRIRDGLLEFGELDVDLVLVEHLEGLKGLEGLGRRLLARVVGRHSGQNEVGVEGLLQVLDEDDVVVLFVDQAALEAEVVELEEKGLSRPVCEFRKGSAWLVRKFTTRLHWK